METSQQKEKNIGWADENVQKWKSGGGSETFRLDIDGILGAYQRAGLDSTREKIVAFGSALLKVGWLKDGLVAYKIAGVRPPKEELIACGDKIIEEVEEMIARDVTGILYPINHALAAYKLSGTVPPEKFIVIGDALVKKHNLLSKCPPCDRLRQQALKAYYVAIRALENP